MFSIIKQKIHFTPQLFSTSSLNRLIKSRRIFFFFFLSKIKYFPPLLPEKWEIVYAQEKYATLFNMSKNVWISINILLSLFYVLNYQYRKPSKIKQTLTVYLQILKYCGFLENYLPKAEILSTQKCLLFY